MLTISLQAGVQKNKLLILGKGGFGHQLADWLECDGFPADSILWLDDNAPGCAGPLRDYLSPSLMERCRFAYAALGDNRLRVELLQKLNLVGYETPIYIAGAEGSGAAVSPSARLGKGTVILPLAYVGAGVRTGMGCIINAGAIVDHNAVLGCGVHIAPGAIVKAGAIVPDYTKVESGTVVTAGQR